MTFTVLLAGGVFRHTADELAGRQAAPEIVLAEGLRGRGVDVVTSPLEDRLRIALARDADIVHVHHLSRAALAAAVSPVARPFVFTPHGTGAPDRRTHRWVLDLVTARSDALVCLSPAEAEERTRTHPKYASRFDVIPNGIVRPRQRAVERRWMGGEAFRILFVGQLIRLKRVDRLLLALASEPRAVLRIASHNPEGLPALQTLAAQVGVADRVEFLGSLSGDSLFEEYLGANVLALPSETEALPSVITEALLTGLPVVASDVGGIRQQVGSAGIVTDGSDDLAFSRGLAALMSNYEQFACRALARSAVVAADYSVDAMVDGHLRLYERLLAK